MKPTLTISFIVTFNFKYIDAAIESLVHTQTPHEVYVIINGGTPEEVAQLKARYPHILTLENPTPLSFAANHNLVMQRAETPYVALLNDDITVQDNALDILVEYLDAHPEAGLVGPQLFYEDGSFQTSAYSDPSLLRMIYKISGLARLTHQRSLLRKWLLKLGLARVVKLDSLQTTATPKPVDVVKGAVMLVRREAYLSGGMMDPDMKAYAEELDWQWRLRQKGWQMVLVPDAKVTHFGLGQSELTLHGVRLQNDRLGILMYFMKNRARWQSWIIRAALIASHGFWGVVWLPFDRERARVHGQIVKMAFTYRLSTATLEQA